MRPNWYCNTIGENGQYCPLADKCARDLHGYNYSERLSIPYNRCNSPFVTDKEGETKCKHFISL